MTHHPQQHRRRDRGFTLVELLMALALVAVLAAITVPSALRMQSNSKLAGAAEQVRAQLAGTRVRAIESGLVYQFRYEPDGRNFIGVPFEREFEGSNLNATGTGGTIGVGLLTRFAGQLPEGFRFIACCLPTGAESSQLTEDAFGQLPNADDLSSVTWSPPILFVPDGAGIDAAFEVTDGRGQAIRVQVRGLTGAATVGRMHAEAAQ